MHDRLNDRVGPEGEGSWGGNPLADLDEAAELAREGDAPATGDDLATLQATARQWSAEQAFQALREVACTITANLDLRSLVSQILDLAIQTVGAERGVIFLGREDDRQLIPMLARSVEGSELESLERISRTIVRQVQLGRQVVTSDAARDPSFRDIPSIQVKRIRSVICLPMMVRGQQVGVIYVDRLSRAQAFPEHAQRFLETFAGLAAVALENARLHGEVLQENVRLRSQLNTLDAFGRLVTISPVMQALLQRAAMVAQADTRVMIYGESGTGKELVARSIHSASARALQPFVAYNCAVIPRDLMESIFFGHLKGAFSGAVRDLRGIFQQADRGTLFLDEITELESDMQGKLLRVIEDGVIRPLGGQHEVQVDVRLLGATSRDIRAALREGRFREELYYRMSVVELSLPALRERREDIPILIDHFLRKYTAGQSDRRTTTFTAEALAFLQTLPWRGNVRELENFVRRILVLCPPGDLDTAQVRELVASEADRTSDTDRAVVREPQPTGLAQARPRPETLADRDREAILEALRLATGNRSKAAQLLGLHRNALVRRMKKLGIAPEE